MPLAKSMAKPAPAVLPGMAKTRTGVSVPTVGAHGSEPGATLVLAPPDAPEEPGAPTAALTRIDVPLEQLAEHGRQGTEGVAAV